VAVIAGATTALGAIATFVSAIRPDVLWNVERSVSNLRIAHWMVVALVVGLALATIVEKAAKPVRLRGR
jgi:hypothetical protein